MQKVWGRLGVPDWRWWMRRRTGTKPRAVDRELGLTVDPDRIPRGPKTSQGIFFFIGRCQMGCIVAAVDDKTLPQAPQIRFTDTYEQGELDIGATVVHQAP
ncbi:hypothetical protein CHU98_g5588 [Xylaria longipes]|nr:hypothetical protein CHU98_g5588 [Xylaria longipes]